MIFSYSLWTISLNGVILLRQYILLYVAVGQLAWLGLYDYGCANATPGRSIQMWIDHINNYKTHASLIYAMQLVVYTVHIMQAILCRSRPVCVWYIVFLIFFLRLLGSMGDVSALLSVWVHKVGGCLALGLINLESYLLSLFIHSPD